jgi:predicted outer membrane repeat protein
MRHPKHIAAAATRSVRSRKGFALAVAAGVAAVPAMAFAPIAGATPPPCTVKDVTTGHHATYTGAGALPAAVAGATAGDTLKVWHTCFGDTTVTKNLTITDGAGGATLNGTGTPGSVVTIKSGVTATINGLDITGGTGNFDVNGYAPITFGGGIDNAGHLSLTKVSVFKNTAGDGGGIFNDNGAKLWLGGKSGTSVNYNSANGYGGGGIYNYRGTVTSTNATVNHNTAAGSSVIGGGGIFNQDGTVWLGSRWTAGTSVNWNTAPAGGGIDNFGSLSHLTLDNGQVNQNTATSLGGGISNAGPNTTTLMDTSVNRNKATAGAGIYSTGKLSLTNVDVNHNAASVYGGGVFSDFGGTLSAYGVTIHANSAANVGGGVASNGAAKFWNSAISGNSSKTGGGGIYSFNSALTLNDSTVNHNTAPHGGGIYAWGGGSVALHHFSTVNHNTATLLNGGGGIFYYGGTTLINVHPGHNVRFNKNGNVVI